MGAPSRVEAFHGPEFVLQINRRTWSWENFIVCFPPSASVFFDVVHLMIHFPSFVESEGGASRTGSFCAGAVIAEVWIVSRVDQILKSLVTDTVIYNVH